MTRHFLADFWKSVNIRTPIMKIESESFEKSHLTESIDVPAGCQSSGHPLSPAVNQQLKDSIKYTDNHLQCPCRHIKYHSYARDNKVYSLITNRYICYDNFL